MTWNARPFGGIAGAQTLGSSVGRFELDTGGVQTVALAGALTSRTSDIPPVQPRSGAAASGMSMFASSTSRAVEQGVINAVVGAIERAAWTLDENGIEADIVLTGGDASRILKSLDEEALHRPHLVLSGLARILETRR